MAKHTITVVHRTVGGESKIQNKEKKTSSKQKTTKSNVANKTKPNAIVEKTGINNFAKFGKGFAMYKSATLAISKGINIYATINEAATGETLRANNLRAQSNALLNPVSFVTKYAVESFLGNLRTKRINESLDYQRQLTGNLAFSKNFNDGTF